MKEHGICAKCKKSVGCPYADDRITGCKNFVLEPELKLTSKEWLRQCNTEQLADFIADVCYELIDDVWSNDEDTSCDYRETEKNYWVEWLKQPHEDTK